MKPWPEFFIQEPIGFISPGSMSWSLGITWSEQDIKTVFDSYSTCAHNVIIGGMWVDHFGTLELKNHSSGGKASIVFTQSGWLGSGRFELSGMVVDAQGQNKLGLCLLLTKTVKTKSIWKMEWRSLCSWSQTRWNTRRAYYVMESTEDQSQMGMDTVGWDNERYSRD